MKYFLFSGVQFILFVSLLGLSKEFPENTFFRTGYFFSGLQMLILFIEGIIDTSSLIKKIGKMKGEQHETQK